MVVPAVGLPSESAHLNAAPPHPCTSIPRWSLYQALSATGSGELKKIPPIPVTLFISVSYSCVRVKGRIFHGLALRITRGRRATVERPVTLERRRADPSG